MFGVLTLVGGSFFNSILVTNAQTAENQQALTEVTKADPDKTVLKTLTTQDSQTIESKQGDIEIEIDIKDKEITIKKDDETDVEISLPENLNLKNGQKIGNSVVFDGNNVGVVVQAVGGGVRQVLNIDSPTSGNTFDFPINLNNGESILINEDGSAMITEPLGLQEQLQNAELQKTAPEGIKIPNYKIRTMIAKPWAKDKNNKDLPTHYTIEGSNLRQHIDFTNAVFPVSADPIYCGNFLATTKNGSPNVGWVWTTYYSKSGDWSLLTYLSDCGHKLAWTSLYSDSNWHTQQAWAAWSEVYSNTGNWGWRGQNISYVWDRDYNYWRMYNQFVCHLNTPIPQMTGKKHYALEVWRKNPGYWETYLAGCNPERR